MKIVLWTVLTFLITSMNVASAANLYVNETKLIEKNTADFIKFSKQNLAEFNILKDAWKQLSIYIDDITSIVKLRVHTVDDNADETIRRLQALNDEKVYVENTLAGLSVIKPKINVLAKKITELIEKYPGIKEANLKNLSTILNNVADLDVTLRGRKEKVDLDLKKWREWQFEIAKKAKEKHQYEVMESLEVIHSLNQINTAFSILNMNFLLAMKNRDYEDAENILQGYARLRSVFPIFYSDKITNINQSQLLQQILNSTESEQAEMTKLVEKNAQKMVKFRSVLDY